MGLPDVKFKIGNGALGGVDTSQSMVCGMVLGGIETEKLKYNVPTAIFSLKDAETLGVTLEYDTTNKANAYSEIKDFYSKAPEGLTLWITLVSNTTLLADVFDYSKNIAKALIIGASGSIQLLGANIKRADDYTATIVDGLDKDVFDAMLKAHELCGKMADLQMPLRAILPGREFGGDVALLKDLTGCTQNRVGISLLGEQTGEEAKVGLVLGKKASEALQRNIGRVASGDLGLSEAYLTDNTKVDSLVEKYDMLNDKGYIFPVKRFGRNGYFFNSDPMAAAKSDDYCKLANGLVIDKVQRIAYDVYLNFVNDDYAVDKSGKIHPVELKRLQGNIENRINADLVSAQVLSSFSAFVDPVQDTLSTGKTVIKLSAQPRGYHSEIEVEVGFSKTGE